MMSDRPTTADPAAKFRHVQKTRPYTKYCLKFGALTPKTKLTHISAKVSARKRYREGSLDLRTLATCRDSLAPIVIPSATTLTDGASELFLQESNLSQEASTWC